MGLFFRTNRVIYTQICTIPRENECSYFAPQKQLAQCERAQFHAKCQQLLDVPANGEVLL